MTQARSRRLVRWRLEYGLGPNEERKYEVNEYPFFAPSAELLTVVPFVGSYIQSFAKKKFVKN